MNYKTPFKVVASIGAVLVVTVLCAVFGQLLIGSIPYGIVALMFAVGLLSKGTTFAVMLWIALVGAILGNFVGWVVLITS